MAYEVTAKGEEKDRSIEREESNGRGGEAEGGEDFIGNENYPDRLSEGSLEDCGGILDQIQRLY